MKCKIFLFILAAVFLVSCGGGIGADHKNNSSPAKTQEKSDVEAGLYQPRDSDRPEQVLIYCDLTTSIQEEGLVRISEKLKQVLLNIPRNSYVSIRLVEKNLLGESPFPRLESPVTCEKPETNITRRKIEAEEECRKKDEPYIKKVAEITDRIKTLRPHMDVSCIMDTLESARDFFQGKDKEKYAFRLIYFSDMIEQCNTNSIYICGSKAQPQKAEILSKIEQGFNPKYNLSSVLGDNISVIITTNDNPNYNCLPLPEQKDIWSSIFSKVGYDRIEITKFNFTQEIPDQLKNTP